MKTLTIRQPHVELIMRGLKRYETRSWATRYRGPLAIHAGAAIDRQATERFGGLVGDGLMCGHVVGLVQLIDCIPVEQVTDCRFGDFSPGRWAWVLGDPERLRKPILARGRLGFWESSIDA